MTYFTRRRALALSVVGLVTARMARAQAPRRGTSASTDWRNYGGDLASTRYAPLDQIDAGNFNDLQVAWRFKTRSYGPSPEYNLQSTPLVIAGVLYTTAGSRRSVVALDAGTGEVIWSHRLDEGERAIRAPRRQSGRGLAYWSDGKAARILYVTIGYQLVALDAKTGVPDRAFGTDGVVDLKKDFDQGDLDLVNADVGLHATPCVAKNVVIVGAAHTAGNEPKTFRNVKGYVRAFDVRTGKRMWTFHTLPQKGEFGYDSWLNGTEEVGNTGVWAQVSVDEALNLAYLPVELPTGDANGQHRRGNALFGESIVAVDLDTGKRRWHYQLVHHGLWDYDIPCAPILIDIPHQGRTIKALAQPTKQSFLYVLDRETGRPVWPIVERKVPKGDVPGEWYAPTQPIPTKPKAYDVQGFREDVLIDYTPELRAEAVRLMKNYKIGPIFTPASIYQRDGTWGTLSMPNFTGGTNWPGGAADPETGIVYVYSKTEADVTMSVHNTDLKKSDFEWVNMRAEPPRQPGEPPIVRDGFRPGVLSVRGLPLVKPPYGRITAIDLKTGDFAWQVPHGETPDAIRNHPALKGVTIPRTGQAGKVGPTVTKTLVICGDPLFTTGANGVRGAMLRAYDKSTGEERGAVYMPAPQTGSPMTYMLDGAQYIVVAIGGGTYEAELLALRLPRGRTRVSP